VPVALVGDRFKVISEHSIFPEPPTLGHVVPIRVTRAFVDVHRREVSGPKVLAKRLFNRARALDVPPLVQRSARYVLNCVGAVGDAFSKADSDLCLINPMPGDCFLTGDTAWDRSEQFWGLVDEWRGKGVKVVTIFYDALPYNEPDFFLSRNVHLWRSYFLRAIHSTNIWAAISETARQDLLRMIANEAPGMKPIAISFPMGVSREVLGFDPAWPIEAAADLDQLILCVGSLDARKGHAILLDALAKTSKDVPPHKFQGYRHEWGSLTAKSTEDAWKELALKLPESEQCFFRELFLHIIGSHHGHLRPSLPDQPNYQPTLLDAERCEAALRWHRLQTMLGPWRLAYLETLLKAADTLASKDNNEIINPTED
jgi:glycosyltransferase involved in cell wall biosynthesis